MDKALNPQLETLMNDRRPHQADTREGRLLPVLAEDEDGMEYTAQTIVPMICDGEPIGAVLLLSRELGCQMGEPEAKVCKTVASFIGKQMEQ